MEATSGGLTMGLPSVPYFCFESTISKGGFFERQTGKLWERIELCDTIFI